MPSTHPNRCGKIAPCTTPAHPTSYESPWPPSPPFRCLSTGPCCVPRRFAPHRVRRPRGTIGRFAVQTKRASPNRQTSLSMSCTHCRPQRSPPVLGQWLLRAILAMLPDRFGGCSASEPSQYPLHPIPSPAQPDPHNNAPARSPKRHTVGRSRLSTHCPKLFVDDRQARRSDSPASRHGTKCR